MVRFAPLPVMTVVATEGQLVPPLTRTVKAHGVTVPDIVIGLAFWYGGLVQVSLDALCEKLSGCGVDHLGSLESSSLLECVGCFPSQSHNVLSLTCYNALRETGEFAAGNTFVFSDTQARHTKSANTSDSPTTASGLLRSLRMVHFGCRLVLLSFLCDV